MRIANEYNHLNAREFLIVNRNAEYTEIKNSIRMVDANHALEFLFMTLLRELEVL